MQETPNLFNIFSSQDPRMEGVSYHLCGHFVLFLPTFKKPRSIICLGPSLVNLNSSSSHGRGFFLVLIVLLVIALFIVHFSFLLFALGIQN